MTQPSATEPFPIAHIGDRYLLFDVDAVSRARREHNVCGVLIGTIPHLSQQNIFLGIPLELMPEECRVLVELGHAYIVEDVAQHRSGFLEMKKEDRLAFLRLMDQRGAELALNAKKKAQDRSEKALQEKGILRWKKESKPQQVSAGEPVPQADELAHSVEATSLFDSGPSTPAPSTSTSQNLQPHFITPTTSHPPLPTPPKPSMTVLPRVPRPYPLFAYLHSKGYFMTPGLRFGCHYTVYPGDPLRYHSHFLTTGLDWDEEFDLLDIVGGGRLGTGVKKAYLIGGQDPSALSAAEDAGTQIPGSGVRAFSIEWAGL